MPAPVTLFPHSPSFGTASTTFTVVHVLSDPRVCRARLVVTIPCTGRSNLPKVKLKTERHSKNGARCQPRRAVLPSSVLRWAATSL
jgi:hypothetical protein